MKIFSELQWQGVDTSQDHSCVNNSRKILIRHREHAVFNNQYFHDLDTSPKLVMTSVTDTHNGRMWKSWIHIPPKRQHARAQIEQRPSFKYLSLPLFAFVRFGLLLFDFNRFKNHHSVVIHILQIVKLQVSLAFAGVLHTFLSKNCKIAFVRKGGNQFLAIKCYVFSQKLCIYFIAIVINTRLERERKL